MGEIIKAAVVEDDADTRKKLCAYFDDVTAECGVRFDVDDFSSGESFLACDEKFDIVLMDIELPGENGMETVRALRERDRTAIVMFVTNMAQFAVKGYEVEAFDFIVKPVSYYIFSVKLKRALERLGAKREKDIWINVTGLGKKKISTAELKYVEVMGHKITYHALDGDYSVSGSIGKAQDELKGLPFELCNRCYLVNLKYVTEVRQFQAVVGGDVLQISHLKRNEFLKKLNLYLSGGYV